MFWKRFFICLFLCFLVFPNVYALVRPFTQGAGFDAGLMEWNLPMALLFQAPLVFAETFGLYALGTTWYLRRYGVRMPTVWAAVLFFLAMQATACTVYLLGVTGEYSLLLIMLQYGIISLVIWPLITLLTGPYVRFWRDLFATIVGCVLVALLFPLALYGAAYLVGGVLWWDWSPVNVAYADMFRLDDRFSPIYHFVFLVALSLFVLFSVSRFLRNKARLYWRFVEVPMAMVLAFVLLTIYSGIGLYPGLYQLSMGEAAIVSLMLGAVAGMLVWGAGVFCLGRSLLF